MSAATVKATEAGKSPVREKVPTPTEAPITAAKRLTIVVCSISLFLSSNESGPFLNGP